MIVIFLLFMFFNLGAMEKDNENEKIILEPPQSFVMPFFHGEKDFHCLMFETEGDRKKFKILSAHRCSLQDYTPYDGFVTSFAVTSCVCCYCGATVCVPSVVVLKYAAMRQGIITCSSCMVSMGGGCGLVALMGYYIDARGAKHWILSRYSETKRLISRWTGWCTEEDDDSDDEEKRLSLLRDKEQ